MTTRRWSVVALLGLLLGVATATGLTGAGMMTDPYEPYDPWGQNSGGDYERIPATVWLAIWRETDGFVLVDEQLTLYSESWTAIGADVEYRCSSVHTPHKYVRYATYGATAGTNGEKVWLPEIGGWKTMGLGQGYVGVSYPGVVGAWWSDVVISGYPGSEWVVAVTGGRIFDE